MQNSLQLAAVDWVNILYQIKSKLLNMDIFCGEFGEHGVSAANTEQSSKWT